MKNFWEKLKRPIFALAPMDDVTDTVFRQIVAEAAKPDVFFTEFVNCEGLLSRGRPKLLHKLQFERREKPIVAQIWGTNLDNFRIVAKQIVAMGFDGVDINMGCPQRDVLKTGACGALISNKPLASEIILAVKDGVEGKIPVSVKTRLGVKKVELDWIKFLLEQKLDALTIHGRTIGEMSKVPAHWDEIGKVVELKNRISPQTIILGNGDIKSREAGLEMAERWKVDGVMIGRGIFENLFIFDSKGKQISKSEKFKILKKHVSLFEKTWGDKKNPQILKKYFKIYVCGFDGAGLLRERLMNTKSFEEIYGVLENAGGASKASNEWT